MTGGPEGDALRNRGLHIDELGLRVVTLEPM